MEFEKLLKSVYYITKVFRGIPFLHRNFKFLCKKMKFFIIEKEKRQDIPVCRSFSAGRSGRDEMLKNEGIKTIVYRFLGGFRGSILLMTLIIILIPLFFLIPPDQKSLYPDFKSFVVLDRNGIPLRQILSKDYKTGMWISLKDISQDMIKATILREDKRFFQHNGVDIIALFRALYKNIKHKKIVSGGSTITMQVSKMVLNFNKRNIFTKIIEMIYALKLEIHLSKLKILEIYLNRVPYGNQNYGIEAASRFYFKKPASQISLSQACILAVIPKAPTKLNPCTNPERVQNEKRRLLKALVNSGAIDSLNFSLAYNEPLVINTQDLVFKAPHFVDYLISQIKEAPFSTITSTIDINLQENIEKMLFTSINILEKYNVNQGAVVVMNTKTGEILALVGSKNYFEENDGQVNGTIALRQPGSSLKPFLYILALSNGFTVSYLMNDTLTEFRLPDGTIFAPRNYGEKYHRLVRAREALASSFNVPAVHLLEKLGIEYFYDFLNKLHFSSLYKKPDFYGLALSLGAAEVRLIELVNAYRTIANKGIYSEIKIFKNIDKKSIGKRVFSEEVAYIITSVLSDNASRIKAFGDDSPLNLPFPCAVKTGTTKNFKDNWCVGFTNEYTVGVWVGNFDGSPMNGVSGISGAAPLFRDIMIELHKNRIPEEFEKPKTLTALKICARTGLLVRKGCPVIEEIFVPCTEPVDSCGYCPDIAERLLNKTALVNKKGISIIYPQNGDIFKLDPHIPYINQVISFKVVAEPEIDKITLKLNGRLLHEKNATQISYLWQPKPGEYELEVEGISKTGSKYDKVTFVVY